MCGIFVSFDGSDDLIALDQVAKLTVTQFDTDNWGPVLYDTTSDSKYKNGYLTEELAIAALDDFVTRCNAVIVPFTE